MKHEDNDDVEEGVVDVDVNDNNNFDYANNIIR